jgi:SAM-dependent methyltransferase
MPMRPVVSQDESTRGIQQYVDSLFVEGERRVVLDAGCGYVLPVDLPPTVHLVGLDASAEALAKNRNIDEAMVADLQTVRLPSESYDAVLCWTVLEHVSDPRAVLENLASSLKPGGALIVGIPNVWSLKGLITKLTPHWFHVWVYRHLLGWREAGAPGFGPYRTYLRREMAPRRVEEHARSLGLERAFAVDYAPALPLPRVLNAAWSAACSAIRLASLRRWDPALSEHAAVFRKV